VCAVVLCVLPLRVRREVLYQQEQRTAQLEALMQKDLLIRVALYCYTFGRFTYSQVRRRASNCCLGFVMLTSKSCWRCIYSRHP
jgi:hypothetical protein